MIYLTNYKEEVWKKSYVSMSRIKDRSKVEYDRSKLCEILKLESSESQNLF